MIELLFLSPFLVAGALGVGGVVRVKARRARNAPYTRRPSRIERKMRAIESGAGKEREGNLSDEALAERRMLIPADIRAELDGSPDYWDAQYHAALEAAGAKKTLRGEPETYTEFSATGRAVFHEMPQLYDIQGCDCTECRHARTLKKTKRGLDMWPGNR